MKANKKIIYRVITILLVVITLLFAIYIMAHRMGLIEGLDFGAGAYYYADIPDFENVIKDDIYHTTIPRWVHIVLFIGWGWLMYRLWCWIERRGK